VPFLLYMSCGPMDTEYPSSCFPQISSIQTANPRVVAGETISLCAKGSNLGTCTWWTKPLGFGSFINTARSDSVLWTAPWSAQNCSIFVETRAACDNDDNTDGASILIYVIDSIPPVVRLAEPVNGAYIAARGTQPVQVMATHANGIKQVQYFFDGTVLYLQTPLTPQQTSFSYPMSMTGRSGTHQILVKAYSNANTHASDSATVMIQSIGVPKQ